MTIFSAALAGGVGIVPYIIFTISGAMILVWVVLQVFGKNKRD